MGIDMTRLKNVGETGIILDRKLWLTADRSEVVEDGDDRAAFLLGSAGKKIAIDVAEALGLLKSADDSDEEEIVVYYEDMKVDELKALLAERDLPVSGTKEELIARLVESDEAEPESDDDGDGD